eukprot:3368325-Amphidinium_carterae.1
MVPGSFERCNGSKPQWNSLTSGSPDLLLRWAHPKASQRPLNRSNWMCSWTAGAFANLCFARQKPLPESGTTKHNGKTRDV